MRWPSAFRWSSSKSDSSSPTVHRKGQLCVEMPAFDEEGQPIATNYRMKLAKTDGIDDRFQRAKGDSAIPYGLWRLAEARKRGYLILVEGESDVHTLTYYDEPALGVAGANSWKEERDAPPLDGIATIYPVVERDRGGVVAQVQARPILHPTAGPHHRSWRAQGPVRAAL